MKRIILVLAILALTAPLAFAGTWYDCNDVSVKARGKYPPSQSVSWGGNPTVEQFAAAGWCTPRVLAVPALPVGEMYVRLDPVINYPYADIGWDTIPDPDYETPSESLKTRKMTKFSTFKVVYDNIQANCMVGTKFIPDNTRRDMVEAIATNRTLSFEVIETMGALEGFPIWLTKNPTEVKGYLDGCIDIEDAARERMGVDYPDNGMPDDGGLRQLIIDCPDSGCVDGLTWIYETVPAGT